VTSVRITLQRTQTAPPPALPTHPPGNQGSPVLEEARSRQAALQQQWAQLAEAFFSKDPARFDPATFNEAAFLRAFCVVLAHASYLPSAELFALLPLAGQLGRTGNENGCDLDYDAGSGAVVLKSARPYRWVPGGHG
jgi:histone-lysine N-methyltransferase SETD3